MLILGFLELDSAHIISECENEKQLPEGTQLWSRSVFSTRHICELEEFPMLLTFTLICHLYHFHMLSSVNSHLSKDWIQTIMTLDEVLA